MVFINYNNTVESTKNNNILFSLYGDNIFKLVEKHSDVEKVISRSVYQYDINHYTTALDYCVNLYFLSLETLEDETYKQAEIRVKEKYKFRDIQTIMAHKGIDLDKIYTAIRINHTPLNY